MKSKFLGCVALLLFACPLHAQVSFTNPAVTHLMKSYSVTKAEAQMRVDLQADIMALSEELNNSGDTAYGDMYIQHAPVFKIVILFADLPGRLN